MRICYSVETFAKRAEAELAARRYNRLALPTEWADIMGPKPGEPFYRLRITEFQGPDYVRA